MLNQLNEVEVLFLNNLYYILKLLPSEDTLSHSFSRCVARSGLPSSLPLHTHHVGPTSVSDLPLHLCSGLKNAKQRTPDDLNTRRGFSSQEHHHSAHCFFWFLRCKFYIYSYSMIFYKNEIFICIFHSTTNLLFINITLLIIIHTYILNFISLIHF